MINVFLFSQNVKIESIRKYKALGRDAINVFLTPHYLFPNERKYLENYFNSCIYRCFADYLSDNEMASCDNVAFRQNKSDYSEYMLLIKKMKNEKIATNLNREFKKYNGYILSDDLGIFRGGVWKKLGFISLECKYYFPQKQGFIKKISSFFKRTTSKDALFDEVYTANIIGQKIIFIGKLDRISYRLNFKFTKCKDETIKYNKNIFYPKTKCQYWTTIHEQWKIKIPDDNNFDICVLQDGILPSNYIGYLYTFKPNNVRYLCWDVISLKLFKNYNLPVSLIPNRKKLYLPTPNFNNIKKILVVSSGSGDWTALKNRSDDDILVYVFSQLAKKYPTIEFIIRCHPTWIHPNHLGVNSINRVIEYFESLNLNNLKLSDNIYHNNLNNFQLSISRNSLDADLKNVDFVFGEHSISMIDAALQKIPFASVNLTNRRNFFADITAMGFPHCESIDQIENIINNILNPTQQTYFILRYLDAIKQYNAMCDLEEI